jgi:hypothetical protein
MAYYLVSPQAGQDAEITLLSTMENTELNLRLAEDDATPDDAIAWESIKEEAQARWQQ